MKPSELLSQIYKPRSLAWSFAGLMLLSAYSKSEVPYSIGLAFILCAGYPHLIHLFLTRQTCSVFAVRLSMLIDAVGVGLVIAWLGLTLEASAVLLALMLSSMLIIGGIRWMLLSSVMVVLGILLGLAVKPAAEPGESGLMTQLALLFYFLLVAYLVYQETRMLYALQEAATQRQSRIQAARDMLLPFVSVRVVDGAAAVPMRKRLTVLFSDIEGFTRLMDEEDEADVAAWLNHYFATMSGIAQAHGGIVDKFMGDGLMVVFGDYQSRGATSDAHACVSMALAMLERQSREDLCSCGRRRVSLRIGIHTGYCLVGSFGSTHRRDYTALGSTVNLASRIEGCAGSNEVLISDETRRLLTSWLTTTCVGSFRLKGISESVPLFRVESIQPLGSLRAGRVRLLT